MSAILHYWRGRGRAETLRLMMVATGVEWTDAPYMQQPEDIAKLRESGMLIFNQLPLLQIDGLNLVQSGATIRYLAHRGNLLGGTDPKQIVMVDIYMEGARDFLQPFMGAGFAPPDATAAAMKASIAKYMPFFERILGAQSTPTHLHGGTLSMADVCLLEVLLMVDEEAPASFDEYPKVKAFYHATKAIPNIAAYLASDRRFPPNSPEYCAAVRKTLGW